MIGTTEILLIIGAVILLFGGTQLPKLAKGLGSFVKEFKSAQEEKKDKKITKETEAKKTAKKAIKKKA